MLNDKQKAAARSFLTTVIAVGGVLIAVAATPGVAIPAAWVGVVVTGVAVARTLLAWVDKKQPLYGRGSS